MPLPHLDCELLYWRARRRLQRLRCACRAQASQARAQAHLHYLHYFGRLPERPQPEETFLFRAMWALVIAGTVAVVAVEAIGQETVMARIDSAFTLPQPTRAAPASFPPSGLSADTEQLGRLVRPCV